MKKLTAILLAVLCIFSIVSVSASAAQNNTPAVIKAINTKVTTESATLSWDKAANATGYRIYIWNSAAKKWDIGLRSTASTGVDIANLTAGTAYTFAVRPYRNTGTKIIWSEKYTKTTIVTAADVVRTVKAAPSTNSVRLAWTKADGAKGYRVYLYNPSTKTWKALKTTYNQVLDVTGLASGTKYIFAVKPYAKAAGITSWAKTYTKVLTATKPLAPATVNCTLISSSSVTLSWKKSAGATGYRIYIWNRTKNAWDIASSCVTSTTAKIGSLSASRAYIFAVRPFVNTGSEIIWGDYTKLSVKTTNSSMPSTTAPTTTQKPSTTAPTTARPTTTAPTTTNRVTTVPATTQP